MADLVSNFVGIRSPNPFWLASAPPTDKEYNVVRAFRGRLGRRGLEDPGRDPPIVNVSSALRRRSATTARGSSGFNNIELITDRPLEINLQEIKQVKQRLSRPGGRRLADGAVRGGSWKRDHAQVEDTGADGIELNFGCPHGMSERGMGSAVGQVPEYVEMVTRWCKQHSRMPVIVKLTPNITDIRGPARAAKRGGADAVSLINTINSIMSVDLD